MALIKPEMIEKEITLIGKAAGRLQDRIHIAAVSICAAWARNDSEHARNVGSNQPAYKDEAARLMSLLQAASPYHANAFSKWAAAMFDSVFVWNKEEETWTAKENATFTPDMLKAVRDTPFFKFSPAQKPKPYDDMEAFEKWLQAARSKAAKPKEEYNFHEGFVAHMGKALADYKAKQKA